MYFRFKHFFDFSLAFVLFLLFLPILLVISLLIYVRMGGPVLYTQNRVGRNNRIFVIYKFRTMLNEDINGGEKADHERTTKLGNFLRKYSIDEIPELLNIMKGEMSFVGPRPLLVEYMSFYNPIQQKRHLVKPGLTGLAQINGRNTLSWSHKFRYDVFYARNASFLLDLRIIVGTIKTVFSAEGVNASKNVTMSKFQG